MKSDQQESENKTVRMELKYCERCGSLWLRESGAGVVYCASCQREVAELPAPKKKPQRVRVPVRPHAVVEDYEGESAVDDLSHDDLSHDDTNFEAAGGVA